MRAALFKTITFLILTAAIAVSAYAQGNGVPAAAPMPFATGETLTYEGKFSKIIRGITVADLTMTVVDAPVRNGFMVKAEAKSKGTLTKIFGFNFLQVIQSTINADGFRALRTVKHDVQKDRVRDSEAVFDYTEGRVTYVETDPKEPMRPPRKIASEITNDTHDLISAIYDLRRRPLAVGQTFEVKVSDSGLVYSIPIKVTAREKQKSIFGKVWCFRLEPEIFGTNRLIEREGSMIVWITDDARRVPVRSQVNSPVGKIEIKLKSASKLK